MAWLRTIVACGVAAGLLTFADPSWSQRGRSIKIVVPFPAGGSATVVARLLGEHVGKTHGPSVVIENRPGAGAAIGYEAVARADPDGNTVVLNGNSFVINPHIKKVNYDPIASFEPVCYLVSSPQVIVVHATAPYRTIGDLIAAAKAKPGELSFAGVGPGATQHIGIEQFKRAAGVNMIFVPFAGGAPAINALLGGHVTAVLQNYSEVGEQVKAGTLRALATTSAKRIDLLPDVPTVAELGHKDFEVEVWFGMMAPAKTPKAATAELATWFGAALQDPEVKAKLGPLGFYPVGMCGDAYAAHIRKQSEEYGRIIRDANIKAE